MAKKEKPKKEKKAKEPKEKKLKMRAAGPRRFGAWVLVLFMLAMIGFGAYKILNAPTEVKLTKSVKEAQESLNEDTVARTKAVVFAEGFTIDYFTFDINNNDYNERMAKYYAKGITPEQPNVSCVVNYVGASGVQVSGNNVDVDVEARVTYELSETQEESGETTINTKVETVTLRVPVTIKDGNCAVVAQPIYVTSKNDTSDIKKVVHGGQGNAKDKDTEEIEKTIKNFFTTYYGGKASELQYFVTKNYGTIVTVGKMTVQEIDTTVNTDGDDWIAECTLQLVNGDITHTQHCYLKVVQGSEGRFYIDGLTTR